MALSETARGWINTTGDTKPFVTNTTKLAFDSVTISDGALEDLNTDFAGLVSLEFTGCTFGPSGTMDDMPVVENAATLTTLTVSGSTGLAPGSNGGVPVSWAAAEEIAAIDVSDNGWTQAQVNAFLVALDTAVQAGLGTGAAACTLDISSNAAPSGAGASAVTALEGYTPAWTVTSD